MARLRRAVPAGLAMVLLSAVAAAQNNAPEPAPAEEPVTLPSVEVVGASPLGGYIDRDKVPGTVQTLTAPDFTRTESPLSHRHAVSAHSRRDAIRSQRQQRGAGAQLPRVLCITSPRDPTGGCRVHERDPS